MLYSAGNTVFVDLIVEAAGDPAGPDYVVQNHGSGDIVLSTAASQPAASSRDGVKLPPGKAFTFVAPAKVWVRALTAGGTDVHMRDG